MFDNPSARSLAVPTGQPAGIAGRLDIHLVRRWEAVSR